jgi:hypothetical protein
LQDRPVHADNRLVKVLVLEITRAGQPSWPCAHAPPNS